MKKKILVFPEHATHEAIYEGIEQALNEYFYTPQAAAHSMRENLKPITLEIKVIPNE